MSIRKFIGVMLLVEVFKCNYVMNIEKMVSTKTVNWVIMGKIVKSAEVMS